ncbi:DUF6114 domain-containing protein [Haloglycomyces albus]|uniref:DUF6114 domain-containing protein n=1 Tax=Haloglycomyces albus TaxID=526067 RepID=UPI00046CBB3F|nr:DUF6114 domain-containing protein [Haloglycomyces albus]
MPKDESPEEKVAWLRRAWRSWRRWRRTRPFWGGLIALLGALELYLVLGGMISISFIRGIGELGTLVICVTVLCMVLVSWFQNQMRTVTGILIVIAGLASMPVANLGGFVIGMLLIVIGGGLIFAWTPPKSEDELWDEAVDGSADDSDSTADETTVETQKDGEKGTSGAVSASAVVAAVVLALAVAVPSEPAYAQDSNWCLIPLFCDDEDDSGDEDSEEGSDEESDDLPEEGETDPDEGEDTDSDEEESEEDEGEGDDEESDATCEPDKMPDGEIELGSGDAEEAAEVLEECMEDDDYESEPKYADGPPVAASDLTTITADKMTMVWVTYDGIVEIQTNDGPVEAMKFTMDSLYLEEMDQAAAAVPGSDKDIHVKNPGTTAELKGNVELYALSTEGLAFGILPIKVTVDNPMPVVPPYLVLTEAQSVTTYVRGDVIELPTINEPVE